MREARLDVRRRYAGVALVAAAGFTVLAVLVAIRLPGSWSWDTRGSSAAHHAAATHGWLLHVSKAVTTLGSPTVVDLIALLAVIGLLLVRRPRDALCVAAVRGVTLGIDNVVKTVMARQRPHLHPALAHAGGFSFPSGHAAGAASCYLPIAIALGTIGGVATRQLLAVAAVVVSLLVAASRVLLGVHFPTDVLAGLALGAAVTAAVWAIPYGPRKQRTGVTGDATAVPGADSGGG